MYRNLYFGQKKSIYHKLFPWAWMMIPLSSCCCCICVCYNIHLWWLYNMLENYKTDKLHHPCNDNTRTMQKQCFFFWVTNFRQELLSLLFCVCAHVVHVMLHTRKCKLTQFPQKQNNKSDWCWSATESHSSWSCRVFRVFGHRCQIQIQQISSFKHVNKVPWYSS